MILSIVLILIHSACIVNKLPVWKCKKRILKLRISLIDKPMRST